MKPPVLIQAGGAGRRMRRSTGMDDKPLVRVRGATLLERNVLRLVGLGFRALHVSVDASRQHVATYVRELARLLEPRGVRLELLVETVPQGTIGAAAHWRDHGVGLLVVNSDNLTGIDLAALLAFHRERRADLTLATHEARVAYPYGVVEVEGDVITRYLEKPFVTRRTVSAVTVLGSRALAQVPASGICSLPELVDAALGTGLRVLAFQHDAPWIDVNDAEALARAEALVAERPLEFECFANPPDADVVGFLITGEPGILLERRAPDVDLHPNLWDTPGGKIEAGERPAEAARRELWEEFGIERRFTTYDAVFDQLEPATGRIVRHYVFHLRDLERVTSCEGATIAWVRWQDLPGLSPCSPVVHRTLAALDLART